MSNAHSFGISMVSKEYKKLGVACLYIDLFLSGYDFWLSTLVAPMYIHGTSIKYQQIQPVTIGGYI